MFVSFFLTSRLKTLAGQPGTTSYDVDTLGMIWWYRGWDYSMDKLNQRVDTLWSIPVFSIVLQNRNILFVLLSISLVLCPHAFPVLEFRKGIGFFDICWWETNLFSMSGDGCYCWHSIFCTSAEPDKSTMDNYNSLKSCFSFPIASLILPLLLICDILSGMSCTSVLPVGTRTCIHAVYLCTLNTPTTQWTHSTLPPSLLQSQILVHSIAHFCHSLPLIDN